MSWKKPLIVGLTLVGALGFVLGGVGPLQSYGYEPTCNWGVCGGGSHVAFNKVECKYYPGDPNQTYIWVTAPNFLTVQGGMASQYATWRPIIYHWNGTGWDETDLPFAPVTKIGYLEFPENFATYGKVPVTVGGYYYLQYDIWWYDLGMTGWNGRDWQFQRSYLSWADPSSSWCWYPDLSHGALQTNTAVPSRPPTSSPRQSGPAAPAVVKPATAATDPPQPSPTPTVATSMGLSAFAALEGSRKAASKAAKTASRTSIWTPSGR